ncbi:MAG: hypothetical protein H0X44_02610, partial [Acidobacteria bacterium]|nr:hypothetical protein [Acidobacteriota bacterium]
MAWFVLARGLFATAVIYMSVLLRPINADAPVNAGFGLLLALLIILAETRLRETSVAHLAGALIGGAIGLGLARTIGAALFWADAQDGRVMFLHTLLLLVLPYLGLVLGARKGEWLEPARLVALFRETQPTRRYRILDTSVIIDGRIADVVETRIIDNQLIMPQFVI